MNQELDAEGFGAALADLVTHIQKMRTDYDERAKHATAKTVIDVELGSKYVRITQQSYGQKSVYGFVRRSDGAILYAAGYKGPYLKGAGYIRGSIYDKGTWAKALDTYGVRTLR